MPAKVWLAAPPVSNMRPVPFMVAALVILPFTVTTNPPLAKVPALWVKLPCIVSEAPIVLVLLPDKVRLPYNDGVADIVTALVVL